MQFNNLIKNNYLIIGRAGLDLYADPPGTQMEDADQFFATVGGSAANIAVGIVRQGGKAALLTCVSDDAIGRTTIKKLNKFGVNTNHIRAVGGQLRNSLALVETRNENCQSVIYRNGAADFALCEEDVKNIQIANFSALIVTGTCLAIEPSRTATLAAINLAKASDIPVLMDIDYRPYSWSSAEEAAHVYLDAAKLCDIVIGNDEEFSVMAGEALTSSKGLELAEHLANTTAKIVIYKMGARGSITFSRDGKFETPIYPVQTLKPTGAGDAFMAGFVTSLAKGDDLPRSVRRGSAAAAIIVGRVGCAPAMPTNQEIDEFLLLHAN